MVLWDCIVYCIFFLLLSILHIVSVTVSAMSVCCVSAYTLYSFQNVALRLKNKVQIYLTYEWVKLLFHAFSSYSGILIIIFTPSKQTHDTHLP